MLAQQATGGKHQVDFAFSDPNETKLLQPRGGSRKKGRSRKQPSQQQVPPSPGGNSVSDVSMSSASASGGQQQRYGYGYGYHGRGDASVTDTSTAASSMGGSYFFQPQQDDRSDVSGSLVFSMTSSMMDMDEDALRVTAGIAGGKGNRQQGPDLVATDDESDMSKSTLDMDDDSVIFSEDVVGKVPSPAKPASKKRAGGRGDEGNKSRRAGSGSVNRKGDGILGVLRTIDHFFFSSCGCTLFEGDDGGSRSPAGGKSRKERRGKRSKASSSTSTTAKKRSSRR